MSFPELAQERGVADRGTSPNDRGITGRATASSDRSLDGRGIDNPGNASIPSEQDRQSQILTSFIPVSGASASALNNIGQELLSIVYKAVKELKLGKLQRERLEHQLEEELIKINYRLLIAKGIDSFTEESSVSGMSNERIGNYVHNEIQKLYVGWYAGRWDIAIERGFQQIVIGPSTGGAERPLKQMAALSSDLTGFWRTLHSSMSSVSPKQRRNSWLRADLIDSRIEKSKPFPTKSYIWEIKPAGNAVLGVLTEARYRIMFNLTREIIHFKNEKEYRTIPELNSGEFIFDPIGKYLAIYKGWNVTKWARTGEIAWAYPVQLEVLPGLILYFTIRYKIEYTPILVQLLIELLKELEKLLKELEKIKKQIEKFLADFIEEVIIFARKVFEVSLEILKYISIIFAIILLFFIVIFVLIKLPILIPAGLAAIVVALLSKSPTRKKDGDIASHLPEKLRNLVIVSGVRQQERFSITLATRNQQQQQVGTTLLAGPIEIHGIPEDAVADFVSFFFDLIEGLTKQPANRTNNKVDGSSPDVA